MIEMSDVEILIEIRGIYDGWSVAKMKDGSYRNRWSADDPRHAPTQECIDRMIATEARKGWITDAPQTETPEG